MSIVDVIIKLEEFAAKHEVELVKKGEVGFGRDCVGFLKEDHYIAHNPYDETDYEPIEEFEDDRLYAPNGVNAYHKHNCLAVLVEDDNFEEGLRQLLKWIEHIESYGEVKIERYRTGATGLQAMVSGTHSYVIKIV